MRLLFIRHAIAVEADEFDGTDFERHLSVAGEAKAKKLFYNLSFLYDEIDVILSSQYKRAAQTAKILNNSFKQAELKTTSHLNLGTDLESFSKALTKVAPRTECVAVVGHEPDFSFLIANIVSNGSLAIKVKKASCIEVEFDPVSLRGELVNIFSPKQLLKMQF